MVLIPYSVPNQRSIVSDHNEAASQHRYHVQAVLITYSLPMR